MSETIIQPRKYLYGHISPETAYVVDDYPWGFRLRTKIRYWIESKNASNGGQRFVSQTINPKTGMWCAPKRCTYRQIEVLFLDENDHVKAEGLSVYSDRKQLDEFKERHINNLNDFQKDTLHLLLARDEVMKNVTFTVTPCEYGPVSLFSNKPEDIEKREMIAKKQEERRKEQDHVKAQICNAINYEYRKNKSSIV